MRIDHTSLTPYHLRQKQHILRTFIKRLKVHGRWVGISLFDGNSSGYSKYKMIDK